MNLNIINELIDDLEKEDASLSNIRNLSALYNVKSHLLGTEKYDSTVKELKDILPSYLSYVDIKKQYQLHKLPEQELYSAMEILCKEIKEFLLMLFSSTDTEAERKFLHIIIEELKETI